MSYDGVVGLAPYGYASLSDYLFAENLIEENIVTLNMNYWPGYHDNLIDSITLGGIPEELAVLTAHTFEHSRYVDEHSWALNLDEVRFGKYMNKTESLDTYVIFDSTITNLIVFKDLWDVLVDEFIKHGFTCSDKECFKPG